MSIDTQAIQSTSNVNPSTAVPPPSNGHDAEYNNFVAALAAYNAALEALMKDPTNATLLWNFEQASSALNTTSTALSKDGVTEDQTLYGQYQHTIEPSIAGILADATAVPPDETAITDQCEAWASVVGAGQYQALESAFAGMPQPPAPEEKN